jgi:hypothetical protein
MQSPPTRTGISKPRSRVLHHYQLNLSPLYLDRKYYSIRYIIKFDRFTSNFDAFNLPNRSPNLLSRKEVEKSGYTAVKYLALAQNH